MTVETRVDLLRHGEVVGGHVLRGSRTDHPLTARGRAQLEAMAARTGPWDAVATSPLCRCAAFAEALAERSGTRLAVDAGLAEYDFGAWSGRALEELWAEQGDALAAFLADPAAVTPPGGETAAAFAERVRAARDRLLADHRGERLLVVSHGGVLRQLVADALGARFSLHALLEWPHAAMSRLRVFDGPDPAAPGAGRTSVLAFHGLRPDPDAGSAG